MKTSTLPPMKAAAGFSLVELMIALVAGMIVVAAVLAFTVTSVRANSEYVSATRLTQELRNFSNHIVAELKRAGYDEAAMDYVANPSVTAVSAFSPILVDNSDPDASCVIYGYDREPGTPGAVDLDNGEVRGIRRVTATLADGTTAGALEIAESFGTTRPDCSASGPDYTQYPATCNTTTGWCPLSDPTTVNVTAFTLGTAEDAGLSRGYQQIIQAGYSPLLLREIQIDVTGQMRTDLASTRSIQAKVKVRADCLRADITECNASP